MMNLLDGMEALVRQAGEIACQKTPKVHEKACHDYVTEADLEVSQFLCQRLPELVPGSGVYSEEGADEDCRHGKWFVIDPIDGTTNLMYSLNMSAISCAYMENGETLAAVVMNPFNGELFRAGKGMGATLNGQPIHVNPDADLSHSLLGFESGPMTASRQGAYFQAVYRLFVASRGIRLLGSAALDLCYIACGRLTAVPFHYLFPWDYAAGELILREAGGVLTTYRGDAPSYFGRSCPLAASNSLIHQALLNELKDIQE